MKLIYKNVERITLIYFMAVNILFGQTEISVLQFVKINNNLNEETVFYFENNWKLFREQAKDRGYIKSFEILSMPKNLKYFDLVLVTNYANEEDFNASEERFQRIIKSIRPKGPLFLNERLPLEFRETFFTIKVKINQENQPVSDIIEIANKIIKFSRFYTTENYDSLAASYSFDGVILPPGADIIRGREAIKKRWILPAGVKVPYHKITPIEINVFDDIAYDIGYYEGKTVKKDASEIEWKGKYLIVWKKEEGDWKIYADAWNRIN
jgi:ketosteroid isomerase-like protein